MKYFYQIAKKKHQIIVDIKRICIFDVKFFIV